MTIDIKQYIEETKGPGKFEGEQPETVYYFDQFMNGDGEAVYEADLMPESEYIDAADAGIEFTLFEVNADESEAFNLPIGSIQILWADSVGFVYSKNFPTRDDAIQAMIEWIGY